MAIIPCVRCNHLPASINFYTKILDFTYVEGDVTDPGFCILQRDEAVLFLSSHKGDGVFGQAVHITVADVASLFHQFRTRGLKSPGDPNHPKEVHEGPIDQTWGTREFYVKDPDGNTLRFMENKLL